MMDSRRLALFQPLGLVEWQLRHGELLACQGRLPAGDAAGAAPGAETAHSALWWSGDAPAWLGDLLAVLGVAAAACQPLPQRLSESMPLAMVLLLPGATEQALTVACHHRFDARLGKRELWRQLCAAGVVDTSRWGGT